MVGAAGSAWRYFRWVMWGGAAVLLSLPLIARAPWTAMDYMVMGAMLAAAGAAVELAMRASSDSAYRLASIIAVAAGFLLIWVNLAVGFFGDEDNPANLMFLGVLGIATMGSIAARGQASGMARVMAAAAAAQTLIAFGGLFGGFASPGAKGVYEVALGTILFVGLWTASALLFRHSAARPTWM